MAKQSLAKRIENGESIESLAALAEKGDRDFVLQLLDEAARDKAKLGRLIRKVAALPNIMDGLGSVAEQAEGSWVQVYAKNPLSESATKNKLAEMAKELGGDAPSPLEELLVKRIILCWLQLHYVDTIFAQRLQDGLSSGAVRMYQNWLDRSQKRYLSAIKTLATIRKLGIPAIQVNIGEKQVNVAGDATTHNAE